MVVLLQTRHNEQYGDQYEERDEAQDDVLPEIQHKYQKVIRLQIHIKIQLETRCYVLHMGQRGVENHIRLGLENGNELGEPDV